MYDMKIELGIFKDFIMIRNYFVDELKLEITENKIEYLIVDAAHVGMANCEIRKGAFETYEVEFEPDDIQKIISIAIDIQPLKSAFKLGAPKDIIHIFGDSNTMRITINNSINAITLLDESQISTPEIPTITFDNWIEIDTKLFTQFLNRCNDVSNHVRLNINENGFRIFASGDTDKVDSKIHKTKLKSHKCYNESLGLYSLSYIYGIVKTIHAKNVDVYIHDVDYPMKMEFRGTYTSGMILLAPRIDKENFTSIPDDNPDDYEQEKNLNNDALW